MKQPFYRTDERKAQLLFHAQGWVGTPFRPNSEQRGTDGGVSCQYLCAALYDATGFKLERESMSVAMAHARFQQGDNSLVINYVKHKADGRFVEVSTALDPISGDLLGFKLGNVVHHTGVSLGDGNFIHAVDKIGTKISSLRDGTYLSRLIKVWRPVEEVS